MCKVDLDKARVNVVLDKAKFNLTNVETTGVLGACNGWWFNPVRSLVLEPIGKCDKNIRSFGAVTALVVPSQHSRTRT
jgi:hypothetical protein